MQPLMRPASIREPLPIRLTRIAIGGPLILLATGLAKLAIWILRDEFDDCFDDPFDDGGR